MTRRKQRGAAFIFALASIVVIGILITTFAAQLDSRIKTVTIRVEQRKAKDMAYSGIARAMVAIQTANANYTDNTDEWYDYGQAGSERLNVGNGSFRIQIIDAGSLVNLNTANEEQLRRMNLTEEQIASLRDWVTNQLTPSAQGAKDEFYNQLTVPYNTKLQAMDTVDELLLVKGFDPATIYEPPQNVSGQLLVSGNAADQPAIADISTVDSVSQNIRSNGQARVNANTANLQQLVQAGLDQQTAQAIINRRNQTGTFTTLGQIFATPNLNTNQAEQILNNVTVSNDTFVNGKINLNTANEAVLNTIPDMTEGLLQDILSRQGTIQDLGELATLPGVDNNFLQGAADLFTVNSQAYIVRCEGTYGTGHYAVEAVITLDNGVPKLTKVRQPLFPNFIDRWGWAAETTVETTLVSP